MNKATPAVEGPVLLTLDDIKKRPLSYSSLKEFKRSPMHFLHYRNKPKDKEEKAALIFGGLLDCLLLTPDEFDSRYCILPEAFLLKDCVAAHGKEQGRLVYDKRNEEIEAAIANTEKVIISQDLYNQASTMRDIIWSHPIAMKIIQRVTDVQCTIPWKDKGTGLDVIGKFDGMGEDIIFELKTTRDADPEAFMKDAYNLGYHIQCATYLQAMHKRGKFPTFWYVVIEKTAPYGISVFRPSEEYVALGKQELDYLLKSFKLCLDMNKFGLGYEYKSPFSDGTHVLDLPPWARNKLEG